MYFLRRKHKQKPRQWGSITAAQSAVRNWYDCHGMHMPVMYVPFWEAAGNKVHDVIGRYHADLYTGNWVADKYFLPNVHAAPITHPQLSLSSSFSITWRAAGNGMILGSTSSFYNFIWQRPDGTLTFYNMGSGGVSWTELPDFNDMATYTIAVDDGISILYKNREQISSISVSLTSNFVQDTIGNGFSIINYSFIGYIDCVVIHNQFLSSDKIATLHDHFYAPIQPRSVSFFSFADDELNLTATNIVTGNPVSGTPLIGQIHTLSAESILTGNPVLDQPDLNYDGQVVPGSRLKVVSYEDRFCNVSYENRFYEVPYEDRFIIA